MTLVELQFLTPDGAPAAGAEYEIQLMEASYDEDLDGILLPTPIKGKLDDQGKGMVSLRPAIKQYYIVVYDICTQTELAYRFVVPEMEDPDNPVRLQDLIIEGTLPKVDYDVAALAAIQEAKANALAASKAAQAARVASESSAASAADSEFRAMRTIKTVAATPPADPIVGQSWMHSGTGRTYTWIEPGIWVEGEAALIVDLPDQANSGSNFDPAVLDEVAGIANPVSTNFLIEQGGIAYRVTAAQMLASLGITINQLDRAGSLARTDIITVTQADGIEKQTTLADIAAAVDKINRGII